MRLFKAVAQGKEEPGAEQHFQTNKRSGDDKVRIGAGAQPNKGDSEVQQANENTPVAPIHLRVFIARRNAAQPAKDK